jgi:hypothetical protein
MMHRGATNARFLFIVQNSPFHLSPLKFSYSPPTAITEVQTMANQEHLKILTAGWRST